MRIAKRLYCCNSAESRVRHLHLVQFSEPVKLCFNVSETNWLPAPGDTFVNFTFEIQFALFLTLAIASLWNLHLLEEGKSIGKVKEKEDIIME